MISTPLDLERPGYAVRHNPGNVLPLTTRNLRASGGGLDALGVEGCHQVAEEPYN